jgi:hypothetical protein
VRPAHWFGTRFAPLVTAGFVAFIVQILPLWWMWFPLWALAVTMELLAIFYFVHTRDY